MYGIHEVILIPVCNRGVIPHAKGRLRREVTGDSAFKFKGTTSAPWKAHIEAFLCAAEDCVFTFMKPVWWAVFSAANGMFQNSLMDCVES